MAKSGGEGLEILVPRIALNIVVEIPDKVDQALLLLAYKRVIGGVKIVTCPLILGPVLG